MRAKSFRVLGYLLAFALVSPVGLLFAIETPQPMALTSPTANLADTQEATAMINQIRNLSMKVTKEVGPLQVEGEQLPWMIHASILARIRDHVNKMSVDLWKLSQMKKDLDPWQQQLLHRMVPNVHELVYQTEAAIQMLRNQEDTMALSLTNYPDFLNAIYHNANQVAGTVGTFTHYVHAAQKMAEPRRHVSKKASS
ncbi:MAG: hypothetical protein M1404_02065 [Acidobacteria bacterium]|nr:hypothetical protein [Acidobacteriota bacterium]